MLMESEISIFFLLLKNNYGENGSEKGGVLYESCAC